MTGYLGVGAVLASTIVAYGIGSGLDYVYAPEGSRARRVGARRVLGCVFLTPVAVALWPLVISVVLFYTGRKLWRDAFGREA